jgi:Holliday junction DNA helicase RuvA
MPVARLRGTVDEQGDGWLIVGVGGVGLMALVPSSTSDVAQVGAEVSLHTHLHVREDALTLYGFSSREELTLFEQLIGVSGVGPKAALGLLSSLDYSKLAEAIVSGQAQILRAVPGIGQKTAERIVLDLRDKLTPPDSVAPAPVGKSKHDDPELIAALTGLGYTAAEAGDAATRIPEDGDLSLEERVRRALQYFGAPTR